MKDIIIVYDNHIKPNPFIQNVIGNKSFGDVLLRRETVRDKFEAIAQKLPFCKAIHHLNYAWELEGFISSLKTGNDTVSVAHFISYFVSKDKKGVSVLFEKMRFIDAPYVVLQDGYPVCVVFPTLSEYISFVKQSFGKIDSVDFYKENIMFDFIKVDMFWNISIYANFIHYISGGFDARFFNRLSGDAYTVTKRSTNKQKMKAEYSFYHLLPDHMKPWMAMPYAFEEDENGAQYTMERYHFTDLAIRWVHGAIDHGEMAKLLENVFYFINTRERKTVSAKAYSGVTQGLYLDKIDSRTEMLKAHKDFDKINKYIKGGTAYESIDAIMAHYKDLYHRVTRRHIIKPLLAIGHGDLCFSNILFHKDANIMKFIDPKGAVKEEELWTDPYYDIAKLSHSICGLYDFFNNMLYQISLDEALSFHLSIPFDNRPFVEQFAQACEKNGFSFELVRLYEASLFLSMLPLHMDNPQKVFGFILNGVNILKSLS